MDGTTKGEKHCHYKKDWNDLLEPIRYYPSLFKQTANVHRIYICMYIIIINVKR